MPGVSSGGRTLSMMATTVRIEIDSELLVRLCKRHPGKQDRELIEDLVRIELGFADMRARNPMRLEQSPSRLAPPAKRLGLV